MSLTGYDLLYGALFWVSLLVALAWAAGLGRRKNPQAPVVSRDQDAEAAIDTLMTMGYERSDAEMRVADARLASPDADFNQLVNLAVRN